MEQVINQELVGANPPRLRISVMACSFVFGSVFLLRARRIRVERAILLPFLMAVSKLTSLSAIDVNLDFTW